MQLVLLAGVLRVVRAGVQGLRDGGCPVRVLRAGVHAGGGARPHVRGGVHRGDRPHVLVHGVKAGVCGVLGGGTAGGVGDAVHAAVRAPRVLGCVGWAGDHAGGHLGQLQGVCGRLSWSGGGGEEQLVQLGDFRSLDRLGHELVLVGVKAELVQLAGPRLVQLQLGVGAQGRDHVVGGHMS